MERPTNTCIYCEQRAAMKNCDSCYQCSFDSSQMAAGKPTFDVVADLRSRGLSESDIKRWVA